MPRCNGVSTYYDGNSGCADEEGLGGEGFGEVVVGHREGGLALDLRELEGVVVVVTMAEAEAPGTGNLFFPTRSYQPPPVMIRLDFRQSQNTQFIALKKN